MEMQITTERQPQFVSTRHEPQTGNCEEPIAAVVKRVIGSASENPGFCERGDAAA